MGEGRYNVSVDIILELLNDVRVKQSIHGIVVGLSKLKNKSKETDTAMEKLSKGLVNTSNKQKQFKSITDAVHDSLLKESKRLRVNEVHLKTYKTAYQKVNAVKMKGIAASNAARVAEKKHGNQLNSMLGSMTKMRWMLVNVTMAAFLLSRAFKLLGTPLIELETEMTVVRKRTKMTKDEIKELRGEFIKLTRSIPESATELAKLGGIAGQLGIRGATNITEFVRVTAMMGAATVLTSEEAALSLAKLSKAYDIPIRQVENLASVINELSNTTAANSKEIAAAMLKMGPAARQLGITADFAAAIGATLIDMGMKAERAGTRMKSAFVKIASKTTEIAALYEDKFGVDIKNAIDRDANEALISFIQVLASAKSGTEALTIATKILGTVGATAIVSLASNYYDLITSMVLASEEFKNATSLQNEFNIQTETTAAQLTLLKNAYGAVYKEWALAMGINVTGVLKNRNEAIKANTELINLNKLAMEKLNKESVNIGIADIPYRIISKSSENFSEFKESIAKIRGMTSEELSKEQVAQLKIRWEIEQQSWDEVRRLIADQQFKLLDDIERQTFPEVSVSVVKKYIEDLAEAKKAVMDATTSESRLSKFKEVLKIEKELNSINKEQAQNIKEISTARANDNLILGNSTLKMLAMKNAVVDFKELLEAENEQYRMGDVTKEEAASRIEDLKEEYRNLRVELDNGSTVYLDVIKYLERLNEKTENLTDTTKKYGKVFSMVNRRISSELKDLTSVYTDLKSAFFVGEKEQLEGIRQIELAIKRETLAQLKLGDATSSTNNVLKDQQSEYEAWVETVNQFIKSAIQNGNLLGTNVTNAVKKFQTTLLATSKFSKKATDSEKSALEKLRDERQISQLEYELGIGEQRFQYEEYIKELERGSSIEFSSANQAIKMLGNQKSAVDALKNEQEEMNRVWRDAQDAVTLYELGLQNSVIAANGEILNQIDLIKELARQTRAAGIASSTSGGGGGGQIGESVAEATSRFQSQGGFFRASGEFVPFANGGLVTEPTRALLGEAGPEMVIPLTGPNAGGGAGITISNINVTGVSGDPAEFAFELARELRRELKTI